MTSLTALRAAVADRLNTIDNLTAYAEADGQINPPAAIVVPGEPAIVYGARMGDKPDVHLVIVLLVALQDTQLSQSTVDPYLDDSGDRSVRAAVNGTLGGLAHFCRVSVCQNYGTIAYGESTYLGAELLLSIQPR